MTKDEVKAVADAILRPALGPSNVEDIDVREDDDWSGDPSLVIDVFVTPGFGTPDLDRWREARTLLSDRLAESGERRFPFISLTNKEEQEQARQIGDEAD